MKLDATKPMLYRDWLNLRSHVLWCYDHGDLRNRRYGPLHYSSAYTNSGAWLVRNGWAQVAYGDRSWRAGPGQWLIVKPGARVQTFASDTHLLSVAFEATWPDGTHWLDKGLPLVVEAADYPALERKGKPMATLMADVSPTEWDVRQESVDYQKFLHLEHALIEWFQVLVDILVAHGVSPRQRVNIDERVMKAVNLLDSRPLGEPLDQEALARQVGLSLVHLTRLFLQDLQVSPRHYFENRRAEYAFRRLSMSDVRANEVAITLGFRSLSHFSKWFKKLSGQSPRDFIKQAALTRRS